MASKRLLLIPVAMVIVAVITYYSLYTMPATNIEKLSIHIHSRTTWSSYIKIFGDGKKYYDSSEIGRTENKTHIFHRPDGVNRWKMFITVTKDVTDQTTLEVYLYDETNKQILSHQITSKPEGLITIYWVG